MPSDSLLSQKEIESLKQLCMDPFIELGSMRGPEHLKCEIPHVVTRRKTLIFRFLSISSARKWNDLQRTTIMRNGHLATAALGLAVAAITENPLVGIGAAIAKDELQAKTWFPEVSVGWTVTRHLEFTYQQFPVRRFELRMSEIVTDELGRDHQPHSYAPVRFRIDELNGLPEVVARKLITDPARRTVRDFR